MTPPPITENEFRVGLAMGLVAYVLWGFVTIFWRQLAHVPLIEVIGHRALWSCVAVCGYLALKGRLDEIAAAFADRKALAILSLSSLILFVNWGAFIWAVTVPGYLLEVSLGYFINPLVNVLIGVGMLGERLNRTQIAAVALASLAVLVQAVGLGSFPFIALFLATTFAAYGYLRKTVSVRATPGFAVESILHLVPAVLIIGAYETAGQGHALADPVTSMLLVVTGPVTALPLILFAAAARRLPLSTMGFLQYAVPTIQFVIAVGLYGEALPPLKLAAFVLIWVALAMLSADAVRRERSSRREQAEAARTAS